MTDYREVVLPELDAYLRMHSAEQDAEKDRLRFGASEWLQRGRCWGIDAELMLPEAKDADGLKTAKAVCAGCVVLEPCLARAIILGQNEVPGVAGGVSLRMRPKIRKAHIDRIKAEDTQLLEVS